MILIKNANVLRAEGALDIGTYVLIDKERIVSISAERPEGVFEREIDAAGKALIPAFYNAHAHSAMTLMRGYGENLALSDWLTTKIFPFEDKLTGEAVYSGTLLAIAESFRAGVVSSTDMYYFCEDEIRAVASSGSKINVAQGFVSFDAGERPEENPRFGIAKKLYENYHGAEDGRVIVDLSIHAEYTSHEKFVIAVADFAKLLGVRMQVHVSETESEHAECKGRHEGRTPTAYFADCGLFDIPTTAAHCVWVEDADIEILADKGVTVASCPVSNLKLASGVCPVPKLLARGVNVAIGTDSVASNNNLSMIEEMKYFALLNKERSGDPTFLSPLETFTAATRKGALSQGRDDCGLIEPGMKADLVLIDTSQPNMAPCHDFVTNLVYSADAGNVALTMVDGRVVYENGEYKTIDIERAVFDIKAQSAAILARLQ